jgi:hypothetical protein
VLIEMINHAYSVVVGKIPKKYQGKLAGNSAGAELLADVSWEDVVNET